MFIIIQPSINIFWSKLDPELGSERIYSEEGPNNFYLLKLGFE